MAKKNKNEKKDNKGREKDRGNQEKGKSDKNEKKHDKNLKKRHSKEKKKTFDKKLYRENFYDFENLLKKDHNLSIYEVDPDGNCLFRSISHQLDGIEDNHIKYRTEIIQFIENNVEYFKLFVADDEADSIEEYIESMKEDGKIKNL